MSKKKVKDREFQYGEKEMIKRGSQFKQSKVDKYMKDNNVNEYDARLDLVEELFAQTQNEDVDRVMRERPDKLSGRRIPFKEIFAKIAENKIKDKKKGRK